VRLRVKGLHRMPVADYGDYEEIPLPPRPSLLERGGFGKDLNKVPAAACWDYEEIPLVDMTNRNKANKINL
jgi:hypothetical protein